MNKREKELQQAFLNNEKAVLKNLEEAYKDALGEINSKIELLMARQDADMQHVIYQVEYQKALKTQVQSILENLQANEFETVSDYLTQSYEDGYIGTLYNIQGQGIPLVFPIDQAQVAQAIQTETKLSEALYTALGKDIKNLQKNIAGEISRGLATGMMYSEIARNVSNYARIPLNNAMRITRTEAHRIQCKAGMDACVKAKERGADVIKQWDASLDKRTRDSHVKLDGERRELEEAFSNGLMYAGDPSGRAEEVINCRCAILQRAKWALDRTETKHLGDMSGMSDEELEPLAKKLHMTPDELRTYQDDIVPINASGYADFKKKYNELWHYEGSEVQKRAEERIAGYGVKQRVRSNVQKMKDTEDTLEKAGNSQYNIPKGVDLADWKPKMLDTTPEQDALLANKNFGKVGYTHNCQRCVPAYEMRRRGYDVTAKPNVDGDDIIAKSWLDVFENPVIVRCDKGNGLAQIQSTMKKYGDGARAEVYVEWSADVSHVFVAEQRNGTTVFIDPQDGNRDASDYFNSVREGKTMMFRIDNLEPSELIKECCEEY